MSAIPGYPVIHVTVAPNGAAHVNIAGQHHDFPPGPVEDSRQAVIAYAAVFAAELRRPVRVQIVDPDGEWEVAVAADGTVAALAPEAPRRARSRRGTTTRLAPAQVRPPAAPQPATPVAPPPIPLPVEAPWAPAGERDDDTTAPPGPAAEKSQSEADSGPTALLKFSTGQSVDMTGAALIGRRPSPDPGEDGATLITIEDPTRELSRTHLRLDWAEGQLWATDTGSANGTFVEYVNGTRLELVPWQPQLLEDGDTVSIGGVRMTVTANRPRGESL